MKTTGRLLSATKDIGADYNEHPFVPGIAKAKNPETIQLFSRYVTLLIEGEMDIHRGCMGKRRS